MGIIMWIIFGALVGWIASLLMGTNNQQGGFANIVIGIIGAVVGGFLAQLIGWGGISGFNLSSFLVALGGAVILIMIVKTFSRSSSI